MGGKLAKNLLIPLGAGGLASFLSGGFSGFYSNLEKPPFSPPGWVFPIVWTILYLLMGVAAFFIEVSGDADKNEALFLYALQLAFNFFWPIIFFRGQNIAFALFWIITLWVILLATLVRFWKIDSRAGLLLIPYLLWVSFAVYLNLGIFRLN